MDANEGQITGTRYDSDSGVRFPARSYQLVMRVTSISAEQETEQGKKKGEPYVILHLEGVETVEGDVPWDRNQLLVRDQLTDARLNQRLVVEIRPEDA